MHYKYTKYVHVYCRQTIAKGWVLRLLYLRRTIIEDFIGLHSFSYIPYNWVFLRVQIFAICLQNMYMQYLRFKFLRFQILTGSF